MPKRILCGIGQDFRGDDEVGLAVVAAWEQAHPPDSWPSGFEAHGLRAPSALPVLLEGADSALLIDCVRADRPVGAVVFFDDARAIGEKFWGPVSPHGMGLVRALRVLQDIPGRWPARISLIGIVGSVFDIGAPMSAVAVRSIPTVVHRIDQWIADTAR